MKGRVQLRGDYGNPKGTGLAKLSVENLESADAATGLTDLRTFADDLKTEGLTKCNVGDVSVTVDNLSFQLPPAANVSVDDELVVTFRKKTDKTIRRLTIPGIDPNSGLLTHASEGKRLSVTGKATLEGLLNTLFGWTNEAVVIVGKLITKA